jgi:hypothetical protein
MKTLIEQSLDYYATSVHVDLMVKDYDGDVEYDESVRLQYKLDLEYRSWGIKDLTVVLDKPVSVRFSLEDGTEKELKVDLSDARVEWYEGSAFYPHQIELTIDKQGNIKEKVVNMYYLKPV